MAVLRIATDSTADVPAALAAELQIAVIPCQVFWGKEVYRDGVDLPPQEFYQKLARTVDLPKTSQPPVSRFVEAYDRLLDTEGGEAVISIHVAGNLSGTVNAAWAAAQTRTDPSRIDVVDSGQVSMGMGWAVIEAARMAQAGATRTAISRAVEKYLKSTGGHQEELQLTPQGMAGACPDCGEVLEHSDGCVVCKHCGYSRC